MTFIVFTGGSSVVNPIESHGNAVTPGQRPARQFIDNDRPIRDLIDIH